VGLHHIDVGELFNGSLTMRSNGPDTPRIPATRGRPNSGRKPGSKNRSTQLAAALVEGDMEALLRTAIQLARAGNVPMLKFLLSRMMPRDRLIKFDLPEMVFADDGVEALGRVMRAVAEGTITPGEGAALATIIKSYTDAIDMADVVKRLDAIENQLRSPAR
jgi:hypothetical protein